MLLQSNDKLLFIVLAGKRIGLGHLTRMNVLINHLKRRNSVDSALLCITPENDIECEEALVTLSQFDDITNEHINAFQTIVIDGPINLLNVSFLKKMRNNSKKIVIINDADDDFPLSAYDYMICCSIKCNELELKPDNKIFGSKYIILNEQFSKLADTKKTIRKTPKRVLLSFGGTDPSNITLTVLNIITKYSHKFKNTIFEVVLGKHSSISKEDIENYAELNTRILRDVRDMADRLYNADLALISGGMTLYESCSVGTPVITINHNDEQNEEAKSFEKLGAIINLGLIGDLSEPVFMDRFDLIWEQTIRECLSIHSKKIISGNGTENVANFICTLNREGSS